MATLNRLPFWEHMRVGGVVDLLAIGFLWPVNVFASGMAWWTGLGFAFVGWALLVLIDAFFWVLKGRI